MSARASRWALVALFAGVAGCGTWLEGPLNQCESDADCGEGRCDLEHLRCVRDPETSLRIGLEVVPASDPLGTTPLPVSFAPISVAGPTDMGEVSLPSSVAAHGLVQWIGDAVSASLTFTLISEIPGGPVTRITAQTTPEPITYEAGTFNYTAQLLPSRIYEVTVEPNSVWRDQLPPLRGRFEVLDQGVNFDFEYPDTLSEVRGVLVDASGVEQSGMIVRAQDAVTGAVISSTYTTGNPDAPSPGYFMLRLTPGTEAWLFSINASSERITMGSLTPTFSVDPSGLIEGTDGLVRILVPPVSEEVIAFQGRVEVDGHPDQGTAATLSFTSEDVLDDVTGAIGTFRTMAATDDTGAFYVQLLPGTYDVVVTPSSSTLGILQEAAVRIDPGVSSLRGQVFAVPERVRFGGWAQTPDGMRIPDAWVRAQARGSTYGDTLPPVALFARSNETLTDGMGQFDLPLDIGLYDIFVEPPAGTSWPWRVVRNETNGGSEMFTPTRVLEVSAPVPLTGRVIYGELEGVPAAGAEVRAYAIVDEGEGNTRTLQIGRATTDSEGAFTLLLPASL